MLFGSAHACLCAFLRIADAPKTCVIVMNLFQPLQNKGFASLWVSYTLSIAATTILPTAITLAILDWHKGLGALGIALSARTFGFLAGALVGGQVSDRFSRQQVLVVASAIRGLSVLAVAWVFLRDVPAISCCLFLAGAGEGAFRSAYQSMMPEVLKQGLLQQGNALTTLSARIIQTGGPVLAVMLYGIAGAGVTLSIAGGCWLLAAGMVLMTRRSFAAACPASSGGKIGIWAAYREGLIEARRHRWFLAGLAVLLIWLGLGSSMQQLILPVVSRTSLGGNTFVGIALGTYAAGALLGGVLLGYVQPARPGIMAFCGLALYGLVPLALIVGSAPLILFAYFLGGLGIELFNIPWFTAIQREVPREMLGRVSSIDFLVSYGAAPLALAALPAFIERFGQNTSLLIAGVTVLFVPLVALAIPSARAFREPPGTFR